MRHKLIETLELIATEINKDESSASVHSFSHGNAGISLYYYVIGKYLNDSTLLDEAHNRFEDAFFSLENSSTNSLSYFGGFTGIFWLYQFYINEGFIENDLEQSYFQFADKIILEKCREDAKIRNFDFLYGIIGYGVYFLERNRYCDSTENLNVIISLLADMSIRTDLGTFWEDTFIREDKKGLLINMGLAHGIPSIILFLAHAYKATNSASAIFLIEEGIRWIQNNELKEDEESIFPYRVFDSKPDGYPSRLAWCYGDLGIAASILVISVILNNEKWKEYATTIALKASKQRMDDGKSGVKDAYFCHGSSGIAFIFNLFHKVTGQPEFEIATEHWTNVTLALKDEDADSGFFMTYNDEKHALQKDLKLGLLEGSAGVGLGLLSCMDSDYGWSRSFMLNLE
jgi:lantibiotic modifying enzyme